MMQIDVFNFFLKLVAACAGLGLIINWVPLVRSFKCSDTPEHGPLVGILLWATLVPASVYWWIAGLPQFPLRIDGVIASTAILFACALLVTAMGWRVSKMPISMPPPSQMGTASELRAWFSFAVLMVLAWIGMANMSRLT